MLGASIKTENVLKKYISKEDNDKNKSQNKNNHKNNPNGNNNKNNNNNYNLDSKNSIANNIYYINYVLCHHVNNKLNIDINDVKLYNITPDGKLHDINI